MNTKHLKRAVGLALVSPLLYFLVRSTGEHLGYLMYPMWVSLPNTFLALWPVVPGTLFLTYHLANYLEQVSLDKLMTRGALLGMLAGLANIPLAVLFALLGFYLESASLLGFNGLLVEWAWSLFAMTTLGAPIALPLGLLFGLSLAWMEKRDRPTDSNE